MKASGKSPAKTWRVTGVPVSGRSGAMFSRETLDRAIYLKRPSYQLLLWMSDAIRRGFIRFDTAHTAHLCKPARDRARLAGESSQRFTAGGAASTERVGGVCQRLRDVRREVVRACPRSGTAPSLPRSPLLLSALQLAGRSAAPSDQEA